MKEILLNWRGGLTGVAVFVVIWAVVFFIAFMTVFGNASPVASTILHGAVLVKYGARDDSHDR